MTSLNRFGAIYQLTGQANLGYETCCGTAAGLYRSGKPQEAKQLVQNYLYEQTQDPTFQQAKAEAGQDYWTVSYAGRGKERFSYIITNHETSDADDFVLFQAAWTPDGPKETLPSDHPSVFKPSVQEKQLQQQREMYREFVQRQVVQGRTLKVIG